MKPTLIISTSGTQHLASPLAKKLAIPWIQINSDKFPNEELRVRISEVGQTTILLGSLSRPVNTRIIEFNLAADAAKNLGASNLIGVLTWYAYSKQDKVFSTGEPNSARIVANLLQHSGVDSLVTLDLHSPTIQNFFTIPVFNISAVSLFSNHLQQTDLTDTVVVSPDAGSVKNATLFANSLHLPLIKATKTRDRETGQVTIHSLSDSVRTTNILIFDDMISTGGTLIHLSNYLHQQGANRITVCCTHHLYCNGAQEAIDLSPVNKLIVTNSIAKPELITSPKLTVLDISTMLANQLQGMLK